MADMALIQEAQLWMRHWRCAASGVSCQIRVAGIVLCSLVTRIKSLRIPNKSSF